jgi:hypothetical protein
MWFGANFASENSRYGVDDVTCELDAAELVNTASCINSHEYLP